eukprot:1364172-Rhodomonas_salina.7
MGKTRAPFAALEAVPAAPIQISRTKFLLIIVPLLLLVCLGTVFLPRIFSKDCRGGCPERDPQAGTVEHGSKVDDTVGYVGRQGPGSWRGQRR